MNCFRCPNIHLISPLDYKICAFDGSVLLDLTDSGGIQEEAPSLNKPTLVMREKTERPEGLKGVVRLVGTSTDGLEHTQTLIDDVEDYQSMQRAQNPYGDGIASQKNCRSSSHIFKSKYIHKMRFSSVYIKRTLQQKNKAFIQSK